MSGREWQPGDVAMVTCKTPPLEFAAAREMKGWASLDPSIGFAGDYDVVDARPLVVIDPEDREQVERFVRACPDDWAFAQDAETAREVVAHMQAALCEFANPTRPKPDEPLGLGAVVEDAEGRAFVRYRPTDGPGYYWTAADDGCAAKWSEINAVRVLSKGVTS